MTICRVSIQEQKNDLLVAEVTGCWPIHSRRVRKSMDRSHMEGLVQELMSDCLHVIRASFGDVVKTYPLGAP